MVKWLQNVVEMAGEGKANKFTTADLEMVILLGKSVYVSMWVCECLGV